MAAGRISGYQPKYCKQLIDHMAEGLSFEAFAGEIGVSYQTLYNWCDKHEEFKEAKAIGFSRCRIFWERLGIAGITGEGRFNATTWIFNMKNRFGWRDLTELEIEEKPSKVFAGSKYKFIEPTEE